MSKWESDTSYCLCIIQGVCDAWHSAVFPGIQQYCRFFYFVQRKNSIGFHVTFHPIVSFMPQLRKPKWKSILSAICIYISLNLLVLPDSYKNLRCIPCPQGLLSAQNQDPLLGKATVLTFLYFTITLREGWKIYLKTCSLITSLAFQISP